MNRQDEGAAPDDTNELDMEALLREEEEAYHQFRRGDVIEGTVIASDRDGVVVDVGSKSEGLVPNHEMQSMGLNPSSQFKSGDPILVYVMATETAEGQILLSVDRARGERGWRLLQQYLDQGDSFDGLVVGFNKGGLLANVEGVHAFVPLSQVVGIRAEKEDEGGKALAAAVGRTLRLKVIELNRRRNRVILSERAALQEWRSQQKDRLLAELKEGEIRKGKVTSIRDFGVFVDLGGADGLAHLSELSWDRNNRPDELYRVGDEVDAYIMKIDAETKKIALSLRRAAPEKWEGIVEQYHPGEVVVGRVTKLVPFGAFARLEGPVEGLIHISELADRRIAHPKEVVREGDIVPLRVVRIEHDRHRLGLSLKQAVDEGERMGFIFGVDGGVRSVPEEIESRFEPLPRAAAVDSPSDPETGEPIEAAEDDGADTANTIGAIVAAAPASADGSAARREQAEASMMAPDAAPIDKAASTAEVDGAPSAAIPEGEQAAPVSADPEPDIATEDPAESDMTAGSRGEGNEDQRSAG